MKTSILAICSALFATAASAQPFPDVTPPLGATYVYTISTTGGKGKVAYDIPLPPIGFYSASLTASFSPKGSARMPVSFSCAFLNGKSVLAQANGLGYASSGPPVSVNTSLTLDVTQAYINSNAFKAYCGADDNSKWTWTTPVEVTLVRRKDLQHREIRAVLSPVNPANAPVASQMTPR